MDSCVLTQVRRSTRKTPNKYRRKSTISRGSTSEDNEAVVIQPNKVCTCLQFEWNTILRAQPCYLSFVGFGKHKFNFFWFTHATIIIVWNSIILHCWIWFLTVRDPTKSQWDLTKSQQDWMSSANPLSYNEWGLIGSIKLKHYLELDLPVYMFVRYDYIYPGNDDTNC